jgi:hypothetical protein
MPTLGGILSLSLPGLRPGLRGSGGFASGVAVAAALLLFLDAFEVVGQIVGTAAEAVFVPLDVFLASWALAKPAARDVPQFAGQFARLRVDIAGELGKYSPGGVIQVFAC